MTKNFDSLVLVALIILLAVAYITMTTPFFGTTTSLVTKASAQETAEERAQEENKNVQNQFASTSPEFEWQGSLKSFRKCKRRFYQSFASKSDSFRPLHC